MSRNSIKPASISSAEILVSNFKGSSRNCVGKKGHFIEFQSRFIVV